MAASASCRAEPATFSAAEAAIRQGAADPSIYERAGAAAATAQAKREQLGRYEAKKNTREVIARDLRRQIDDLRSQLGRYAEALEEDLAQGREKVAGRTREGLAFEKSFSELSNSLLAHLRNKPECRDLVAELLAQSGGHPSVPQPSVTGELEPKPMGARPV